jgi:hypothetical protein
MRVDDGGSERPNRGEEFDDEECQSHRPGGTAEGSNDVEGKHVLKLSQMPVRRDKADIGRREIPDLERQDLI